MNLKLTEKQVKLCIRKSRLIFKLFPDDGLAFVVGLF